MVCCVLPVTANNKPQLNSYPQPRRKVLMSIPKIKVIKVDDSNRVSINRKPGTVYYDTDRDTMFIQLVCKDAILVMPERYTQHMAEAGVFPDWVTSRCLAIRRQRLKTGYRKPYDVYPLNQDTKDVTPGRMYFTDDYMLIIALDKCGISGMDREVYQISPDDTTDLMIEGLMPEWVMQKFASAAIGAKH